MPVKPAASLDNPARLRAQTEMTTIGETNPIQGDSMTFQTVKQTGILVQNLCVLWAMAARRRKRTLLQPLHGLAVIIFCSFMVASQPAQAKAPQAQLNVMASPSVLKGFNSTTTLSTTGGSGTGAVRYAVRPGDQCSVSGNVLRSIGVGDCVVLAVKSGDDHYEDTHSFPLRVPFIANIGSPGPTDQTVKTTQTIARYMQQRANTIVTDGQTGGRQIDRLIEASGAGRDASAPASGLSTGTAGEGPSGSDLTRLGLGARVRAETWDDMRAQMARQSSDGTSGEDRRGPSILNGLGISGGTEDVTNFGFATSLSALRQAKEHGERASETASGLGMAAGMSSVRASAFSPFDIWIEGRYGGFRDRGAPIRFDGHFGLVSAGVDYVLNKSLLMGAYVQFDSMRQEIDSVGAVARGQGWMAGPYATVKIAPNLFWQTRAAWGRSINDVSPLDTYVDSFSSRRWLAATALTGNYLWGNLTVRPSASVSYFEDTSMSYSDSLGETIPGTRVSLGQVKIGPEFIAKYQLSHDLVLKPRLRADLIWNFDAHARADGIPNLDAASSPEGVRGRLEIGLRAEFARGPSVDLSGSYDGIGTSAFHAVSGRAGIRVPFN